MFARVLFVDEEGKRVGLSVLPHLLRMRPYAFRVALGQVLSKGEVVETMDALESKNKSAAVLEFQAGDVTQHVYLVKSRGHKDGNNNAKLDALPGLGEPVRRCRVLAFNRLEGIVYGSTQQADLTRQYIAASEIPIGAKLEGKVLEVKTNKLLIDIGGITVFCDAFQASSKATGGQSDLTKRFQVGQDVRCRALRYSKQTHLLHVTLRRELIDSKYDVVASYSEEHVGTVTQGCVVHISQAPRFVLVVFYNNVYGRIYETDLGEEERANYRALKIGQVVTVSVINIKEKRMFLTLNTAGHSRRERYQFSSPLGVFRVGEMLDHVLLFRMTKSMLMLKVTRDGVDYKASLATSHLSDFPDYCLYYEKEMKEGIYIDGVMIISINDAKVEVTRRASLMHGLTLLPSQGPYQPHTYYLGELRPTLKKSSHVLVDLHHALDSATSSNNNNGDLDGGSASVMARPLHIGAKGCKALVPDARCPTQSVVVVMQPSSSGANASEFAAPSGGGGGGFWRFATEEELPPAFTLLRTRSLWKDKEHFQSSLSVKEQGLKRFLPGTLVTATIKEVKEIGCVLSFPSAPFVYGFASLHQCRGTEAPNESVTCYILDVDKVSNVVDVSLLPRLTESASPGAFETNEATIELLTAKYIIASLARKDALCKLVLITPSYNNTKNLFDRYRVLERRNVSILAQDDNCPYAYAAFQSTFRPPVVYKSLGEGSHVLRVGQVVPLTIIEAKQPLDTHTLFGQVVGSKYVVQVYFTDIYDDSVTPSALNRPWMDWKKGSVVDCKIIQIVERNIEIQGKERMSKKVEIYGSIRPSVVSDASPFAPKFLRMHDLVRGRDYVGYVYHHNPQDKESPSLISLGRYCKARVFPGDIVAPNAEKGVAEMRTGSKVLCQVKDIIDGVVLSHVRAVPLASDNNDSTSAQSLKRSDEAAKDEVVEAMEDSEGGSDEESDSGVNSSDDEIDFEGDSDDEIDLAGDSDESDDDSQGDDSSDGEMEVEAALPVAQAPNRQSPKHSGRQSPPAQSSGLMRLPFRPVNLPKGPAKNATNSAVVQRKNSTNNSNAARAHDSASSSDEETHAKRKNNHHGDKKPAWKQENRGKTKKAKK